MIRRFLRWLVRRAVQAFDPPDVSAAWLRADRLAQGKLAIAPPESLNRWKDREPAPWPDDAAHRQHRRLRRVK